MSLTPTRVCKTCRTEKPTATDFYISTRTRSTGETKVTYTSVTTQCKDCFKAVRRKPRECLNCGATYFHIGSAGARRRCCDSCATIGRVCPGCDTFKPLDKFYLKKPVRGGSYCKDGCALAFGRLRLYGISRKEYAKRLDEVGGACPACGRSDRPLVVDHCHDSGAVRGLLCGTCNTGIGMFGDSIKAMRGAIAYLETKSAHSRPEGLE